MEVGQPALEIPIGIERAAFPRDFQKRKSNASLSILLPVHSEVTWLSTSECGVTFFAVAGDF
jgi:hypothetical protein